MGRDLDKYGKDQIEHVEVWMGTGYVPGAGTNGEVYLALGGREFNLKRPAPHEDRGQGSIDHYQLGGHDANVEHPAENNPAGIPISQFWNRDFSLRFEPQAGLNPPDTWNVFLVTVDVRTHGGYRDHGYLSEVLTGPGSGGPEPGTGLWLGWHYGLVAALEIEVQEEDKRPLQRQLDFEARLKEYQARPY